VKLTALDAPPPGAGLLTTTGKLPAVARPVAFSARTNCVLPRNTTLRGDPLMLEVEFCTEFVPMMMTYCEAPPACADSGLSVVIVGTGLPADAMAMVTLFEFAPPILSESGMASPTGALAGTCTLT
jgi:hypothetical protein